MKKEILTDLAPQPIGPYSQAIATDGKFLFISMQIPLKPDGTLAGTDIETQTRQVISNLASIAKAGGSDINNIVKTTLFLKDMNDFGTVNGIYSEYFSDSRPARSAVEVSRIPKDALVAMEATALIP